MTSSILDKYKDKFGQVILNDDGLFELIYGGHALDHIKAEKTQNTEQYNYYIDEYDLEKNEIVYANNKELTEAQFVTKCVSSWFMPDMYKTLNVYEFIKNLVKTDDEKQRIAIEMTMFEERKMMNVLRFLIYLVDSMRKNKIVWGVGRGSSVASYVLFLIGIHKVNSLKYNLDIKEFLK